MVVSKALATTKYRNEEEKTKPSQNKEKKIACEDMPVIKVKAAILKGLYCFLGVTRKERK